jgi:hypothetical protein
MAGLCNFYEVLEMCCCQGRLFWGKMKQCSSFVCVCSYRQSPGTLLFEVVSTYGLSLQFIATVKLERMQIVH